MSDFRQCSLCNSLLTPKEWTTHVCGVRPQIFNPPTNEAGSGELPSVWLEVGPIGQLVRIEEYEVFLIASLSKLDKCVEYVPASLLSSWIKRAEEGEKEHQEVMRQWEKARDRDISEIHVGLVNEYGKITSGLSAQLAAEKLRSQKLVEGFQHLERTYLHIWGTREKCIEMVQGGQFEIIESYLANYAKKEGAV